MPAKNLHRIDEEGTYSHIYNKGVEKKTIFNEAQDYDVFLGFLREYLTAPADPESSKKDFTVHGRVYRGTPHQPKNYEGKVELISYNLMPTHFHLLLRQMSKGALQSFIRSLCTRYSMYFNKKYKRTGALFEGPYKSVSVKDEPSLLLLTYYLHQADGHSSYPEYLGKRSTSWVKPEVIKSFFSSAKTDSYKHFIEKYELSQKEKELLTGIILESETEHHEGRGLASSVEKNTIDNVNLVSEPLLKVPQFVGVSLAVFLVLVGLGVRNINASAAKSIAPSPTPLVLSSKTEEERPKKQLVIKISDGATTVNIRENPTINSKKIGEAKEGDVFEFVSLNSGWYEVKLANNTTGFILGDYIQVVKTNN